VFTDSRIGRSGPRRAIYLHEFGKFRLNKNKGWWAAGRVGRIFKLKGVVMKTKLIAAAAILAAVVISGSGTPAYAGHGGGHGGVVRRL